jgi:uncharacterized protein
LSSAKGRRSRFTSATVTLPQFRFHPDPIGTGSVVAQPVDCVACNQSRTHTYVGPFYSEADLRDALCPWCLADGTAARCFEATFTDVLASDVEGVAEDSVREVMHRTPGFAGWQQERWLSHCGEVAAFLGAAGANELLAWPDAAETVRDDLAAHRWPAGQIEEFLQALNTTDSPTAYVFRCLRCETHLAYADFL